jgi:hypothetical protein
MAKTVEIESLIVVLFTALRARVPIVKVNGKCRLIFEFSTKLSLNLLAVSVVKHKLNSD